MIIENKPPNLKLLDSLKIITLYPLNTFKLSKQFTQIFDSNSKKYKISQAVTLSMKSFCPDLNTLEYQDAMNAIITVITSLDADFCRELIVEMCIANNKLSEIKNYIDFAIKIQIR